MPQPPAAAARPRLSTAPLLAVSDRHARFFWRLLSRKALLYTEMISTGALLHGHVERHLRFDAGQHPVALQIGGSHPHELAHCARLGEQWGYDEINLNCGCPSPRVQRGAFGACLMRSPQRVADGIKAMQDAVQRTPISVKHRIGLDKVDNYGFVRDFVGTLADAGCRHFIVHARSAWLQGLSAAENRSAPPLRYDTVYRLKRDFAQLHITLNGGIHSAADIAQHWQHVDAVMLGRQVWRYPWSLALWDDLMDGCAPQDAAAHTTREAVEAAFVDYMQREALAHGTPWHQAARAMLGLRCGLPGARNWRQVWSNTRLQHLSPHEVMALAHGAAKPPSQEPKPLEQ